MAKASTKITVKLAGQIATDVGKASIGLIFPSSGVKLQTVLEQVDKLTNGRWRNGHIIAVNNEHVIDYNVNVDEDSDILVISPMAGG